MSLTVYPQVYLYRHQKNVSPQLNLSIGIQCDGTWYMHNDPSVVFLLNNENTPEIHGGGNQTVNVRLSNAIQNWDEGLYELKLRVFNFSGTEESIVSIYLIVTETEDDVVYPKSLSFEAVRNVVNAEPQKILVASGDSNVTVNLPTFLELVSHELIGGGHVITVKPVMQGATLDSEYNDIISIDLPSEPEPVQIPVNYLIHAGYDESYSKSVHFTGDNELMRFYKTTTEKSFLKLVLTIQSFNTDGHPLPKLSLSLDFPFVKEFAEVNLGKELESYFERNPNYKTALIKSKGVYPAMEVELTAIEFKYDDFSILNQDLIPKQYFLIGRNPLRTKKISDPFFVNNRPSMIRHITVNGMIALNFFKPAMQAIPNILVKKNGEFLQYLVPDTQTFGVMKAGIATVTVRVKSFNDIGVGDELSFELSGQPSTKINYLIKPEGVNSHLVGYLTAWNTYELFEFTGSFLFDVEYTHDLYESISNFVDQNQKLDCVKTQKLTINTGWLQKAEAFLVDELIGAKKAILIAKPMFQANNYESEENTNIELVPVQSKITNYDSDNNLVQFDVEFLINPRNENEIYSR